MNAVRHAKPKMKQPVVATYFRRTLREADGLHMNGSILNRSEYISSRNSIGKLFSASVQAAFQPHPPTNIEAINSASKKQF
jgi:hypothetical protein